MSTMRPGRRRARSCRQAGRACGRLPLGCEGGATAVEFALLLPVLLLLLAGVIDLSRLLIQTMEIRAAAQAGADFARERSSAAADITEAVRDATPLAASAAVNETVGCVVDGAIVASAGSTCPAGGAPGRFVTVVARSPYAPLLPGPHRLALPDAVSGQAMVRVG